MITNSFVEKILKIIIDVNENMCYHLLKFSSIFLLGDISLKKTTIAI